ncbi:protoporphyrinogen oxidase HemJ [Novosphingobium ginsenosidimutans]
MLSWVLSMTYLWLKAGHVTFVIFWMAGLFMLPRFFVYHQEAEPGSAEEARWIDRERRLLRIILWPAMGVTWALGLALAFSIGAFTQPWFHAKLGLVLILSAYNVWMAGYAADLAQGRRRLEGKRLRILNEVPGIATVLIAIMVIVKPF